jgi:hypothetical protein
MDIDCVITSINYDDYLRIIAPYAKKVFSRIVVVTSPEDEATANVCDEFEFRCIPTNAWTFGDGKMNKGRALNVGLDNVGTDWVCALDADIVFPPGFESCFREYKLDPHTLYSAKRRMCPTKHMLEEISKKWDIERLAKDTTVPVRMGQDGQLRLWGTIPSSNRAGIAGYMQLWNRKYCSHQFPSHFKGIISYDVEFALKWETPKRMWLPKEVVHLGRTKVNWHGRKSNRWD